MVKKIEAIIPPFKLDFIKMAYSCTASVTVSITTTVFTFIGLPFGARLGERYERNAERAAGATLVVLAVLFAIGRLV
jgi:putative Mn2+ efflux pump MntP